MQSHTTTRGRAAAAPARFADSLRAAIAAQIRALDDDALLDLVGDRVAELVARLASPRENPPPPCAEKPKPRTGRSVKASAVAPFVPTGKAPWKKTWLPWPRSAPDGTPLGIDMAGDGPQGRTMAEEIRAMTLARWTGSAMLLDKEELVSDVYEAILRRNHMASAWDPRRGTLGTYVYRVVGGRIATMLERRRRTLARELQGDQELFAETTPAAEQDPDAAPFDPEAVPLAPRDREAFFLAACCLEMFGELPVKEQLWERALRQRKAEQAQEIAAAPASEERAQALAQAAPPDRLTAKSLALDAELRNVIAVESAGGRPVFSRQLLHMTGLSTTSVRRSLRRLAALGAIEARLSKDSRGRANAWAYWARSMETSIAAPTSTPTPARSSPASSEKNAALDDELAEFISSETAHGRPVLVGELAAMLGLAEYLVRRALSRLVGRGVIEARLDDGDGRYRQYWAKASTAYTPATDATPSIPLDPEPPAPEPAVEMVKSPAMPPPPFGEAHLDAAVHALRVLIRRDAVAIGAAALALPPEPPEVVVGAQSQSHPLRPEPRVLPPTTPEVRRTLRLRSGVIRADLDRYNDA